MVSPFQLGKSRRSRYTTLSPDQFEDERVVQLVQEQNGGRRSTQDRRQILEELIELHGTLEKGDDRAAQEIRRAFLLFARSQPTLLAEEPFIEFMANHVEPEDFAGIEWAMPAQIVEFYEALHGAEFYSELGSEKVMNYTRGLLRQALRQFEKNDEYEKMYQLLQRTPIPAANMDAELLRLRDRARMYEMRRVQRRRRLLYGYLILQAFLIVVVFPLLFINAENGAIQDRIEQTIEETTAQEVEVEANVERHTYSYMDGLYWSLITAGSIGYGDITPITVVGRIIAAALGVSGVITIGVTAGLILDWITPRRLM